MSGPHAAFIAELGGTYALAKRLGLASNVTGNWAKRAIPWQHRPAVAAIAAEKGVPLPAGFITTAPAPTEAA